MDLQRGVTMVCLDCVERVEIKLWVPREAHEFFVNELEWNDDSFVLELLMGLASVIESRFRDWDKATKVRNLIEKIIKEM